MALMERIMLEKCRCPAPERIDGRIRTCMSMPSAGLEVVERYRLSDWFCQQPLGGIPSFFEPNLELCRWATFSSHGMNQVTGSGLSEQYLYYRDPCLSGFGAQPPSGSVAS